MNFKRALAAIKTMKKVDKKNKPFNMSSKEDFAGYLTASKEWKEAGGSITSSNNPLFMGEEDVSALAEYFEITKIEAAGLNYNYNKTHNPFYIVPRKEVRAKDVIQALKTLLKKYGYRKNKEVEDTFTLPLLDGRARSYKFITTPPKDTYFVYVILHNIDNSYTYLEKYKTAKDAKIKTTKDFLLSYAISGHPLEKDDFANAIVEHCNNIREYTAKEIIKIMKSGETWPLKCGILLEEKIK